jgi:uncharacterized glyoxalase superfamily protein PhnB
MSKTFTVVDLTYFSLYIKDYAEAIAFYSAVFGAPSVAAPDNSLTGWEMGATHLTIFPSSGGAVPESNPRNAEFAVQVSQPGEVDTLYTILVAAGAKAGWEPKDTEMYVPMRFAYVDDPFGTRIDIICPL